MSAPLLLLLRFLMAAALYVFLAAVLVSLWRDLKRQGELLALRQPVPLSLAVGEQAGRKFTLHQVLLGRDPACDVCLDDPTVSGQHARLSFHHNQWWLEDLHSTNGTFLNEEPVTTAVVVTGGDELRCGQVKVRVLHP